MLFLFISLLWSITSTTIISVALSVPLLFRSLLLRVFPCSKVQVSLYEGIVFHERRRPVHHSFSYHVHYALFDLGQSSHPSTLSLLECRQIAETTGPVKLLTIPQNVGYEMNPLNIYYCYDFEEDSLKLQKCIAEVTNTPWGEKVMFVFRPNYDAVAKPLHVSPFMDMSSHWIIRASEPEEKLSVVIRVQHPDLGAYFSASLQARRTSSADHALFFWLKPHLVALRIYWNAVLLWLKNVHFMSHPKYTTPTYREDAVVYDNNLHAQAPLSNGSKHKCRWIQWRDAKWPWS